MVFNFDLGETVVGLAFAEGGEVWDGGHAVGCERVFLESRCLRVPKERGKRKKYELSGGGRSFGGCQVLRVCGFLRACPVTAAGGKFASENGGGVQVGPPADVLFGS